ncbi:FAD-binding oxidoreductase [Microbacteriaceae bacterium K1510]|nr:FAD-binding oxidoreductase [Microbacteriaceae bacterium K1510]
MKKVELELSNVMRDGGRVVTEPLEADRFRTDWRRRFQARAAAIVCPTTTAEVQAILRYCEDRGLTVVPQGGNTGLCGGASPQSDNSVLVSLTRLNKIRSVAADASYVIADAGLTVQALNDAVAHLDRFLPVTIGAQATATLGGIVSTNAGGINVLRYGNTRRHVLGLEVVLANGEVWDGLRPLRKDNSGPDLKHLFIGTEGTLGIITGTSFELAPRETFSASILLRADSFEAVQKIAVLASATIAGQLSSLELLSGFAVREVCARVLSKPVPLDASGPWYVLIRAAGRTPVDGVMEEFAQMAFEHNIASDGVVPRSIAEENELWRMRDSLSELHRHLGPSLRFDLAMPTDRLGLLIQDLHVLTERIDSKLQILCFGHMGDGNLHFSVCSPNSDVPACSESLTNAVHETVWRLGGTISAEHGIGRIHVEERLRQKSQVEIAISRRLKDTLDPRGTLNLGVIF